MESTTEEVIGLIKQHRILYDLSHPEYKNNKVKNKTWDEIGSVPCAFFILIRCCDFLNILQTKLINGLNEEKTTVVVIIWALAANSQRAKIVLKSARLDSTLQNTIKQCQLLSDPDTKLSSEDLDRMYYVLNLLKDDKIR